MAVRNYVQVFLHGEENKAVKVLELGKSDESNKEKWDRIDIDSNVNIYITREGMVELFKALDSFLWDEPFKAQVKRLERENDRLQDRIGELEEELDVVRGDHEREEEGIFAELR